MDNISLTVIQQQRIQKLDTIVQTNSIKNNMDIAIQ